MGATLDAGHRSGRSRARPKLEIAVALCSLAATPIAAQTAGPVRTYLAPRAPTLLEVDGDLVEEAWDVAEWSKPFVDIRGGGQQAPAHGTRMKMLWDDQYLYVAAELEEPHLWATLEDRDAIIYHDHDFEVFLDPDGDGLGYYELEINALGTEFDLFLDRPYSDGGQADIAWDMPGLRSGVRLDGTLNDPSDVDAGWTVEIAIPWEDLRPPGQGHSLGPPESNEEWRMNFSRVQWPLEIVEGAYWKSAEVTPENPHPEDNWVWSPQGEIDMHVPARWGRVRFVDRLPPSASSGWAEPSVPAGDAP